MFYKCLNSLFDYCKSKPVFEGGAPEKEVNEDDTAIAIYGRKCTRNHTTCSKRQSPGEAYPVKKKAK